MPGTDKGFANIKFVKARDDYVAKEEEFIVLSAVVKQKEVSLSELEKVRTLSVAAFLFSASRLLRPLFWSQTTNVQTTGPSDGGGGGIHGVSPTPSRWR